MFRCIRSHVERLLEAHRPSVCLSVHTREKLENEFTDFDEIWYWKISRKIVGSLKFSFI
jgi:hypothetical protein